MMDRYIPLVRKPRQVSEDDYWPSDPRKIDVIVDGDAPQATGLFDANGVALYRVRQRWPVGFVP